MSTTAVERATQALPGKARARVLTKQKLKWMLYAGLTGFLALAAARYGDDWWTVGRFAFVVATFLCRSCATSPQLRARRRRPLSASTLVGDLLAPLRCEMARPLNAKSA
jgi:hypothetical protein